MHTLNSNLYCYDRDKSGGGLRFIERKLTNVKYFTRMENTNKKMRNFYSVRKTEYLLEREHKAIVNRMEYTYSTMFFRANYDENKPQICAMGPDSTFNPESADVVKNRSS